MPTAERQCPGTSGGAWGAPFLLTSKPSSQCWILVFIVPRRVKDFDDCGMGI
jgi:hypothetical protein